MVLIATTVKGWWPAQLDVEQVRDILRIPAPVCDVRHADCELSKPSLFAQDEQRLLLGPCKVVREAIWR